MDGLDYKDLYKEGEFYHNEFRRSKNLDDLEKAIDYGNRALELIPSEHLDLLTLLSCLGAYHDDRYRRLGKLDDMEKSMEYDVRALEIMPETNPHFPNQLANIGVSYGLLYQRFGKVDSLNKAIKYKSRALKLTPDGHPDLPGRYAALGVSYVDRYQRLGEGDDLNKSIEYNSRALELTPDGHLDLPNRHAALGVSYTDRYRRLKKVADLNKAIEYKSRALELTPENHPDLSSRYATLGVSYTDRYRELGQVDDLNKAVKHSSCALELTPDDHPDLPSRHATLGVSYSDRYRRTGKLLDLYKSFEHDFFALNLTPDRHPTLSLRHFNLAVSSHELYLYTSDPDCLHSSLDSFRKASQLLTGAARDVFNNAFQWAKLTSKYNYLNPIEAFRAVVDLLPHFIWLGATTSQRYHDLSLVENVAVRAASAAIRSSEYSLALEWLEHARCVVWNQSLMLRSPVDTLESSCPALAAQLRETAKQLHHASSQNPAPSSVTYSPEHRHQLAKEYDDLLAQVRKLPGFETFLRPMEVKELLKTARYGPVVVINCHDAHCDALVIKPGKDHVDHLALPEYTEEKARNARSQIDTMLRNKRLRERGFKPKALPLSEPEPDVGLVLASLWNEVVKPVLDYLGYLDNDASNDLPHVTWCPTGAITFLPLHAAGDYGQPRSRVFDHVISSYTPTLNALLSSVPTVLDRPPRVLAVGQSITPGHSPLQGVTRELECLENHIQHRAVYSQLKDDQATTATVLAEMEQYDWVHLACHAHQNIMNPTKSGFYLHDGTLDLVTITQRSFKNKGLAFLSACQTATGDERLPDEAIHLASGMMMAGYPSVVASMWSVMDEDAPFVADKVYEILMKAGKVGNGEAGRAVHYAVAGLREKVGEKEFGRWVPYIHIGS
ncbi:TPR-like protein, partial [Rhizoctonia solani]